jgi:hypothetical protein
MKLRWNFLQRTHRIHSIGPKTHVLWRLGPFRYSTKVDAKLAEMVPLTRKFSKQSHIRIFRNERSQSTPLDTKLMFWGVLDCFITARKSMQKLVELVPLTHKFGKRSCVEICHNERTRSTLFDRQLMFWGISDRFVTARKSMQSWPN